MRYFRKECLSTKLHGGVVPWIECIQDNGVIETDNPQTIAFLESVIAKRKGGVSEITAAECGEWKKKQDLPSPRREPKPRITPPLGKVSSSAFSGRSRNAPVAVARKETSAALASFVGELPSLAANQPGGPPTRRAVMEQLAVQQQQSAAELKAAETGVPFKAASIQTLVSSPNTIASADKAFVEAMAAAAAPNPEPAAPLRKGRRKASSQPEGTPSAPATAS